MRLDLRPLDWLAWFFTLVMVAGFMLPWVKFAQLPEGLQRLGEAFVESLQAEGERDWMSEYFLLSEEEKNQALDSAFQGLAGFQIPLLQERKKDPEVWGKLLRLRASTFLGEDHFETTSKIVYALPAIAIFAAAFVSFIQSRVLIAMMGAMSAATYLGARYWINETYMERLAVGIYLGGGLWLCLYSLLALVVVLFLRFLVGGRSRL